MADHNLTQLQRDRMAEHQAALLAAETRRLGDPPTAPPHGSARPHRPGGIVTVRRIDFLDEEGVLACLTGDGTDLDDALLAMLAAEREGSRVEWDDQDDEADRPTRILYGAYHRRGEVQVGKFRKQPCICGMGHKWDLMPVDIETTPTWSLRGTFWGVLA